MSGHTEWSFLFNEIISKASAAVSVCQGVRTDQLALAIEVRGDDDAVGLFGEVLKRADEFLLGRQLNDGCPGEIRQTLELPALDGDAVGKKRLAFGVVGRACQAIGHVGR